MTAFLHCTLPAGKFNQPVDSFERAVAFAETMMDACPDLDWSQALWTVRDSRDAECDDA